MSHRQRDTHVVEVVRPTDSSGSDDWMGAPVQDAAEPVVTLSGQIQSPIEDESLSRDDAGEVTVTDKTFWTTDPDADQVSVDDHLTLTAADGDALAGRYVVMNIREYYGRRVSAPDMLVFDINEFAETET